jgi:arginyl-tRNA--protein-N-Asp/Glu arginylyltransferase
MKRFRSEFAHSYGTYSFGYCEYAIRESNDALNDVYDGGFLPYTGSPNISNTLYMARSARVRLNEFDPSSENRRILKKFDGTLARTVTPLTAFDRNETFLNFCLDYFEKRHGGAMPRERLETILNAGFITDVVTYTKDEVILAYVFIAQDDACSHFWFSFYDLAYIRQSLGLWLLLDCARIAKEERKKHYYIGTVYGEKGLYKTNFPALEFWDGATWNVDLQRLRMLCKSDAQREIAAQDLWKNDLTRFD